MRKNSPASAGDKNSGSIPGLGRSPGRGHGNSLCCACLESPMNRGAWRATNSRTRLKDLARTGRSAKAAVTIQQLLEACVHPVAQLCPTLCDPLDCSPPGSTVHGILQVRTLEWVAIPFSRGIFLTEGSNLHLFCLLHWLADSSSLVPPGEACDSVKRKQTVAQHDGPL